MPRPIRGQHRLREYRFSQDGRIYFVTGCTEKRQPLLEEPTCSAIIFDELRHLESDDPGFELIGSVVMPDHVHALLRLGEAIALGVAMQRFRGRSARAINGALSRTGQLWQRGYFEHVLRPDEDLQPVLHYMWHNPSPPGKHFRCRAEVWAWFKECIVSETVYYTWLR
jgi:putative transposase